jgi:hypothetical protein
VIKELGIQEESLLLRITHREFLKWVKKGARAWDKVELLQEVNRKKDVKDHDIEIVSKE